jgi:hypothetical protein
VSASSAAKGSSIRQHRRLHRERARDGDALFHAAGQHVRIDVCELGQIDLGDQRAGVLLGLLARHDVVDQQRKHHVSEHRFPRQQLVEFLEHHHAVGAGPVDHLAVEPDGSLDRLHESADGFEQRRLPATGRPEQHEALAGKDLEIDPPGRGHEVLGGLVLQRDALRAQHRRGPARTRPRASFRWSPLIVLRAGPAALIGGSLFASA